jgi:hypothetical protein
MLAGSHSRIAAWWWGWVTEIGSANLLPAHPLEKSAYDFGIQAYIACAVE